MTSKLLSQIPNVITVVRVLLVIPTAWCLLMSRYVDALALMRWPAHRMPWMDGSRGGFLR
jgi:phosphatidylglycerophosphate synthase